MTLDNTKLHRNGWLKVGNINVFLPNVISYKPTRCSPRNPKPCVGVLFAHGDREQLYPTVSGSCTDESVKELISEIDSYFANPSVGRTIL